MAKYQRNIIGNFDAILQLCEKTVQESSISASLEDGTDYTLGSVRVAVRIFERYSWLGKNRVSLNLTLVGAGEQLVLTAITSGGSQAVFFKINTWGEEAFLDTLVPVIEGLE